MELQPLDVVAVIRAPLEQYPPSFNQVALIAEAGLRVGVVELSHPDYPQFTGQDAVERLQAGRHVQLDKEQLPTAFVRLLNAWKFRRGVVQMVRRRRPKLVIAYDPNAMWSMAPILKELNRPRIVWHFHELFLPTIAGGGALTARAVKFACRNAARVDEIVFPDQGRAEVFRQHVRGRREYRIVMNCPRRRETLPNDTLAQRLREAGHGGAGAIYFHGWIGPSRCLEPVIASIPQWPDNTVLVLVGPVSESVPTNAGILGQKGGSRDTHFVYWKRCLFRDLGARGRGEVGTFAGG